jgi:hypothetical protein
MGPGDNIVHRRIDHIPTDHDGSLVLTLVNGRRDRLDQERRDAFRDVLAEKLQDTEPDRSVIEAEPSPPFEEAIGNVRLVDRGWAGPRAYALSTSEGVFDMNANEAKAILFGP